MIATYVFQIVRVGLSKSHPQLPKCVYFNDGPVFVAIVCLGHAMLGPKGWYSIIGICERTDKVDPSYVALIGFFLMWPPMLLCVVRENAYRCDILRQQEVFGSLSGNAHLYYYPLLRYNDQLDLVSHGL